MSNLSTTTSSLATIRYSLPKLMLHSEGLAVLIAAAALYASHGYSWLAFALLLLTPDLVMLGYLWNIRTGTILYNLGHTYTGPLLLSGLSLLTGSDMGLQASLIWLAHIGMDRTVGYGLKYPDSFKETHLSRV